MVAISVLLDALILMGREFGGVQGAGLVAQILQSAFTDQEQKINALRSDGLLRWKAATVADFAR